MSPIINPKSVSYKEIDLSWMIGRVITSVTLHEPATWFFTFGPSVNIGIYCLWRFIGHGSVVLTVEDHGHQFGLPAPSTQLPRVQNYLPIAA